MSKYKSFYPPGTQVVWTDTAHLPGELGTILTVVTGNVPDETMLDLGRAGIWYHGRVSPILRQPRSSSDSLHTFNPPLLVKITHKVEEWNYGDPNDWAEQMDVLIGQYVWLEWVAAHGAGVLTTDGVGWSLPLSAFTPVYPQPKEGIIV